MKLKAKSLKLIFIVVLCAVLGYLAYTTVTRFILEHAILKEVITRLQADSRVAEILVTGVNYNEVDRKKYTTIKFLEYDSKGNPLEPRYFDFSGNIIQFQSLVVRFDDKYIRQADRLKGKSVYLFWKVFMLDGAKTQEYDITKINEVPQGYKLEGQETSVETEFWSRFWEYALDPQMAKLGGIKNAQIEAPGTMFIPGNLYTIRIEHDGGLRIDSAPISKILIGENIPFLN